MLLFLVCLLIGIVVGVLAGAFVRVSRGREKLIRHEFRGSSMPDLDIDEELLESGQEDKAIKDFI